MPIYVRTRGRSRDLDYQFLGPPPSEGWWHSYSSVSSLESPTILLECDGKSWRSYTAGIASRRQDSLGRGIQVDLVVTGQCGPVGAADQETVLTIIATSIDALADPLPGTGLIPGDRLDAQLDERAVEEMVRYPDEDAAARADAAVRAAYRGVSPGSHPLSPNVVHRWLGGLGHSGSRDQFVELARRLLDGRSGRALMLNFVADYGDITRIPPAEGDLGVLVCQPGPLFGIEAQEIEAQEVVAQPEVTATEGVPRRSRLLQRLMDWLARLRRQLTGA
jgi:hypothetical protein